MTLFSYRCIFFVYYVLNKKYNKVETKYLIFIPKKIILLELLNPISIFTYYRCVKDTQQRRVNNNYINLQCINTQTFNETSSRVVYYHPEFLL